jgi:hypothetical protein
LVEYWYCLCHVYKHRLRVVECVVLRHPERQIRTPASVLCI